MSDGTFSSHVVALFAEITDFIWIHYRDQIWFFMH